MDSSNKSQRVKEGPTAGTCPIVSKTGGKQGHQGAMTKARAAHTKVSCCFSFLYVVVFFLFFVFLFYFWEFLFVLFPIFCWFLSPTYCFFLWFLHFISTTGAGAALQCEDPPFHIWDAIAVITWRWRSCHPVIKDLGEVSEVNCPLINIIRLKLRPAGLS